MAVLPSSERRNWQSGREPMKPYIDIADRTKVDAMNTFANSLGL